MKVVLVDDESLIRMDLRDILESGGCEIIGEGANGVEAIRLAKQLQPDVILMDVKMPELDGIEAARQIGYNHYAPVVLLTAFSQDDLVKKAKDSGVFGYLIKPVREEQLIPTLQMAIGRFKEDEQMRADMASLEQSLEDRKLISRATGLLMDMYKVTEDEAFSRIRVLAMKKQVTIATLCEQIIASASKK